METPFDPCEQCAAGQLHFGSNLEARSVVKERKEAVCMQAAQSILHNLENGLDVAFVVPTV